MIKRKFSAPPKPIRFTKVGFEKIQKDFDILKKKRIEAVQSLKIARELGDLSENGAYKAARFELSGIDRQLRRLTFLLRFGVVTENTADGTVGFGSRFSLDNGREKLTFTLVEQFESDPVQGKLSVHSPFGKAVLGKKVGDTVTVFAPAGEKKYTLSFVG